MIHTFLRPFYLLFVVMFFLQSCNVFAQPFPPKNFKESDGWLQDAQKNIEISSYNFKKSESQYVVANKHQTLAYSVEGTQLTTIPLNNKSFFKFNIELCSINGSSKQKLSSGNIVIFKKDNYLRYDYASFSIEYKNDEAGLRQNFIIKEKSKVDGLLTLSLKVSGDLRASVNNDKAVDLLDTAGKTVLRYDDLVVWDATNKKLNARMFKGAFDEIKIIVNDASAIYPITIDPLTHNPEWTTSANGVLPSLLTNFQLQTDAVYGYKVSGLGDVNGDGFDDVAIGAPGAIDVIAGPTTIVGAGAVFVYFGSASGLPVIPSKILRATTPLANALFGFSIDGGNAIGDSKNDIVVGAPGDSYSTTASSLPFNVTVNVTAGKVYIFRGEDLTAAGNPAPFLSVFLTGTTFFSSGVTGLLGSNISTNALFGFSVAVTEDITGDGLGEVVIGSPGYAELALLPVRSGAALVYYSGNLATNTPVKLTAPTSTLLGIPTLNNEGLLFGFCVDGVGDYNQDGLPDIVVGAPAGVTLTLGNFLGGSAYVYNGIAAAGGVNANFGTKLSASASLINTLSNLFGYSVKGVRNAAGARDGSIIAGAPAGNLLSAIVGGLQLKTGSVNVFVHTASPGASQLPTQQISSPRGNSLLTILTGQNINISALFGASIDNMLDVNCDGFGDIIVGEPLSTAVGIINTNAVGGTAVVLLGNALGTYYPAPFWAVENNVSFDAGVNAGSLLGYSVAGARHVRGATQSVRALVGAPGAALDFSSGIFNIGNTFGTLYSFAAGSNGLGKGYLFNFNNCGKGDIFNPDVNVTFVNITVPGNVKTNDLVPLGTAYGTPQLTSGPAGGSISMNADGTYFFSAPTAGIYIYRVPVCILGQVIPCPTTELKITVLATGSTPNPPVANTDITSTKINTAVIIPSLINDRAGNTTNSLNPASVTITVQPKHGIVSIDLTTGNTTYTPITGFTGIDSLTYQVCDNGIPIRCATANQFIRVETVNATNNTVAVDDYASTVINVAINGNVSLNDIDAEGDIQIVTVQNTTVAGVGTLTLAANGTYTFIPVAGFTGPVSFPYTTCDNGNPQACASATLYIIVEIVVVLPIQLISFTGSKDDLLVKLNWKTANEINSNYFEVEYSEDGLNWKPIGRVTAAGNSTTEHNYGFIHNNPMDGINYYRLRQVDVNGTFEYSNVVLITFKTKGIQISSPYPNPFFDNFIIEVSSDKFESANIQLYDNAGREIKTLAFVIQKGRNKISLNNLENLPRGIYYVVVKTSSEVKQFKIKK